ncbi:MAG: helix-turn-helix domain-containing protein [Treponema sp.]|jgi:transcriptional regulator with XRE-family HTH domain|nr:helix-turn-helix domain-containing protein [Treponema sp.]
MMDKGQLYRYIGDQIRKRRQAIKKNQEDLAIEVNLTRSSIAQIESGKQAPSIFVLYQICEVLRTSIFDVLPKGEFDTLSRDRFTDKEQLRNLLDKVKETGGEYAEAKYSNNNK